MSWKLPQRGNTATNNEFLLKLRNDCPAHEVETPCSGHSTSHSLRPENWYQKDINELKVNYFDYKNTNISAVGLK